jgi:hypothetical protein
MADVAQRQSTGGMDTTELSKEIKESMGQFRRTLSMDTVCEQFRDVSFDSLEIFIFETQRVQEGLGELMNFSRMKPVLNAFRNFDATYNKLQIDVPSFKDYLWGPMRFILKVQPPNATRTKVFI